MDKFNLYGNLKNILDDLKYHLYYLEGIGIRNIPIFTERMGSLKNLSPEGTNRQKRDDDLQFETLIQQDLFSPPVAKVSPREGKKVLSLEEIEQGLLECTRCELHRSRKNIVFGVGHPQAQLVFVGEGPGVDEDLQGEPFVGRAGALLTKIIEAMGLKRSSVYICNVVKCHPPGNRTPQLPEIEACKPYLIQQLLAIRPRVICALGLIAAQTLLDTRSSMSGLRGRFFPWRGIKLLPTYHTAYLLRNPWKKKESWEDMQKVMRELGL